MYSSLSGFLDGIIRNRLADLSLREMECIGWLTELPGRLQYEVWRLGRDKAKLDRQNFTQNHTQNQPEEGSVAFASERNAPLDKDILESLLRKLNVATTLIAT